jgi:hypothetical protein
MMILFSSSEQSFLVAKIAFVIGLWGGIATTAIIISNVRRIRKSQNGLKNDNHKK